MNGAKTARRSAYRIALVGICAALIEGVKLALAGIPNVEGVTLLTALFGFCFGGCGVLSAIVFVSIEPLIYGFAPWVISYYLYWPLVSLAFALLSNAKVQNRWVLSAVAVLLTAWFGVLTSIVDTGLFTGNTANFFYRFSVIYARGVWFYAVQILCNAVVFPTLFPILSKTLGKLKNKFFGNEF